MQAIVFGKTKGLVKGLEGFDAVLAALIAFIAASLMGFVLVPLLHKLKYGQSIREVGPIWHKKKQGTPTMGGFMFIVGIAAALAVALAYDAATGHFPGGETNAGFAGMLAAGLFMAAAFGFIGFMDDYIKVVKKRNLGLTAKQKFLLQLIVGAFYLLVLYFCGDRSTTFVVPFFNWRWDFGVFYWPAALLLIVGMVNSVNLTDGIDGLAGSVTFVAAIALMLCAGLLSSTVYAAVAAALAGGCIGFLMWNFYPARIFMGDTGSLFLGGMLCALAFGLHYPLILLPVGIIYIAESLSVIIQVISFKTTGKRVFKMSPIHHHFEMSGWSEVKIVAVFTTVTALFCAAAVVWLANDLGRIHF